MSRSNAADKSNTGLVNRHPVHDSGLKTVGYETQAHFRNMGRLPDDDRGPVSSAAMIQLLADHLAFYLATHGVWLLYLGRPSLPVNTRSCQKTAW